MVLFCICWCASNSTVYIYEIEEKLSGIGVGSPGTVDAKNGIVLYSNNFNWENILHVRSEFPMMQIVQHSER